MSDLATLAASGKLAQTAEPVQDVPTGAYALEPKADGWRVLVHRAADGVHVYARSGGRYTGKLPAVEADVLALPVGTWLDAEAIAPGGWSIVQSVMTTNHAHVAARTVRLAVFDLLAHAGIDARSLPYAQRRELLDRLFARHAFDAVDLLPSVPATAEAHEAFIAAGYEGSVCKRLSAPYASGRRGRGWVKVKPQTSLDAFVVGVKPGENGWTGLVGAVVFGQYDEAGNVVERGRCSGRISLTMRKWLTQNADRLIAERAVIEVGHMGKLADGLRHPQLLRMRPDRVHTDVLIHD